MTPFIDNPYVDLGAWYRTRLAAGYDPVFGSQLLGIRCALREPAGTDAASAAGSLSEQGASGSPVPSPSPARS